MNFKLVNVAGVLTYFVNGKPVGKLRGNSYITWKKTKSLKGTHWLRKCKGYAITDDILSDLKDKEINKVIILEQCVNETKAWEAPLQQYLDAELFELGGFEPQRGLPLKEMKKL